MVEKRRRMVYDGCSIQRPRADECDRRKNMKKKFAFIALAAALFCASSLYAKDPEFDDMLRLCAEEICKGIDGKVKTIAVVDVETEYWALSDHIVDELNHWFVRKLDSVNVVTRDEFTAAITRNEIKYSQSGEVTDETMQEFARLGYDCVVKGNFSDVAGGYQLIITALNTESLKQYASWKGKLKAKDPDVKYLVEKSQKSPRPVVKLNKRLSFKKAVLDFWDRRLTLLAERRSRLASSTRTEILSQPCGQET